MSMDQFVGSWRLLSYEKQAANGRSSHPFGRYPRGHLIYSPDGMMAVAIMPQRRGQPAVSPDAVADPYSARSWLSWRRLVRLVRYVLAATRYISYSGRYSVEGDTVIHHIEVSQMPSLVGADQERAFAFNDGRLTLTAVTAGVRQTLVWERIAPTQMASPAKTGRRTAERGARSEVTGVVTSSAP